MNSPNQIRNGKAKVFQFRGALQRAGWTSPAFIVVNERGIIRSISGTAPAEEGLTVEVVNGYALPGFRNSHSHAFQFAMAGMAERHQPGAVDDFWSWREAMYRCASALDPEQMQAVASMAYAEMLRRGYTHVAEFHYLHHDKDGKPYSNLAEMSVSLVAAAAIAGIKITLVPVFYQKGGFGKDASPAQRRFCFTDSEQYLKLLSSSAAVVRNISNAQLGFGVHSLRAAEAGDIRTILADGPKDLPFHMHAAEQLREVEDAKAYLRQRPVEWILDNLQPDERFHLIHCTHLNDGEVVRLAESGANVVLCPGTEANLGDGIFRLTEFAAHGGQWSIGTDSHISLNPLEDLRWVDYAQRLTQHRRNTFADGAATLVQSSFLGGQRAMGLPPSDYFEAGKPLDAVVYNADRPLPSDGGTEHLLPALVYTADSGDVVGTLVDGDWIARDRHHRLEDNILREFRDVLKTISGIS